MEKIIVTTTIYPVSKALKKFASFKEWFLIIVGDKKTPHEEYVKFPMKIQMCYICLRNIKKTNERNE